MNKDFVKRQPLYKQNFQIFRHIQFSLKIPASFFRIQSFSVRQIPVLGMIQKQISNTERFGSLTGIFDRRMMLFIRPKNIRLSMQTKRFVQKPFAVLHICPHTRIVRFISAADEFFPVVQLHAKTKLLIFRRMNVKKSDLSSKYLPRFSVFYDDKMLT